MIDDIPVFCAYDEIVEAEKIIPNPKNPNQHGENQIDLLAKIIKGAGWRNAITVSKRSGFIVKGHGRYKAAQLLGAPAVPVEYQDYESEAAEYADLTADNRIAELAEMDEDMLADILKEIEESDIPLELSGYTDEEFMELLDIGEDEELGEEKVESKKVLQERFIIPPFSILDSRTGDWQARKKAWKNIGIKSEVGRGNDGDKTERGLTFAVSCQPAHVLQAKAEYEKKIGRTMEWKEYAKLFPEKLQLGGTSIFDPVVCELFYRWLCPAGGTIIDPFAGGSVRGVVAALTGKRYTGVDLSARQIEANESNWAEIDHTLIVSDGSNTTAMDPKWIAADSRTIDTVVDGEFDLMFTCPPYADLEVYSDDPRDISNMEYPQFLEIYREIIQKTTAKLKDNAFAVCVVGEVRGKDGNYYNFVGDTIQAFLDAGMDYYNEIVLVNSYASAAMRATNYFNTSRKHVKVHQNILVFAKGDPKEHTKTLPDVGAEMDTLLSFEE